MKGNNNMVQPTRTQESQIIADYLDTLELSDKARKFIAETEFYCLPNLFFGYETAEEVESLVNGFSQYR